MSDPPVPSELKGVFVEAIVPLLKRALVPVLMEGYLGDTPCGSILASSPFPPFVVPNVCVLLLF